jgi:hypothetical protein
LRSPDTAKSSLLLVEYKDATRRYDARDDAAARGGEDEKRVAVVSIHPDPGWILPVSCLGACWGHHWTLPLTLVVD